MRLLTFDYETTGVDIRSDIPVQIAAIGIDTEVPGLSPRILMNTFTNPCRAIPEGAAKVHGIYDANVQHAPDYMMGIHVLLQFAAQHEGLLTYNGSTYDVPMTENLYLGCNLSAKPHIDLLDVIYRYMPDLQENKLSYVYQYLTGSPLIGAHGAVQDCLACVAVLDNLLPRLNMTAEALAADLKIPRPYEIMPIGKHRGARCEQIPTSWYRWMYENAKDMRPDLEATVTKHLGI